MEVFDLFSALVLFLSFLHGRQRGLALQLAALASLVLGYVVAQAFGEDVAEQLGLAGGRGALASWALCYALVALGVYYFATRYRRFLRKHEMEDYDSHLGGLAGAIKGGLLLSLFTVVCVSFVPTLRPRVLDSYTGRLIARLSTHFDRALPRASLEAIRPWIGPLAGPQKAPAPAALPRRAPAPSPPAKAPAPAPLPRGVKAPRGPASTARPASTPRARPSPRGAAPDAATPTEAIEPEPGTPLRESAERDHDPLDYRPIAPISPAKKGP
jgi:uncharacterized membrane protein required for colicin V production